MTNGRSTAVFAGGLLSFTCDKAAGAVLLARQSGNLQSEIVALTISTSATSRAVSARPSGGDMVASFAARDPLLDAMAFSRGRFAIQSDGLPTLYVPSWPEIGRVLEDCR